MIRRYVLLFVLVVSSLALAADPANAVRELLARYVAGDLQGAAAHWIEGAPRETFIAAHRRRMNARCAQLVSLRTNVVSTSGDDATIDTDEIYLLDASRIENAHSRFVVRRERVASWVSREETLAQSIAADPARRAELVAASPDLATAPLVRALARIAILRVNENRVDDADALIALASSLAERIGDPAAIADALSARSVAIRYHNPPDPERSLVLAREARDFALASGDRNSIGGALLRLSRAEEMLTYRYDPEPLRAFLDESADRVESAATLSLIATGVTRALNDLGRVREGMLYAELTAEYAEESGDPAAEISAELLLGGAHTTHGGEGELAMRHFRRAVRLATDAGFENVAAFAIASVAAVQTGTGRLDEAMRTVEEGLKTITSPQGTGELLMSRCWLRLKRGELEAAERDLRRALELKPGTAHELEWDLAWIRFRQGRLDEALSLVEQAEDRNGETSRWIRARALRCRGRADEALQLYEELAAEAEAQPSVVTDPDRLLFAVSDMSGHSALMNMLVEQGRIEEALRVNERMKAVILREIVARGRPGNRDLEKPAERKAEQALDARIASLNRALVAAGDEKEIASLREQLLQAREDLIDFRQRKLAGQPIERVPLAPEIDLEGLPSRLDDVTIVSYAPTDEGTTIFVVGPKTNGRRKLTAHVAPVDSDALHRLAQRFASLINERNLRADAFGVQLYELLLRPLERDLGSGPLCILPVGGLWNVPFHALKPKNGTRLIDRLPVFYAPSIAVLALAESKREQRRSRGKTQLLAFANPQVGAETASLYRAFDPSAPLGALPEAETEVRAIGRIYGREHSAIRIGAEAREAVLKRDAPHYDVLHVATHGLVDPNAPMFSALVLSPDKAGDDGVLEAREIAALDLDIDLAVFSACDTGKSSSSGVLGFSWALFAAGCPTTVVSQWNAQSASTAKLMIEFHRQLVAGASKPEALRRAQLAVRRDPRYAHPFYWAPFMVVGVP